MKLKYTILSSFAALCLSNTSVAQNSHPSFNNLLTKINPAAEHISMTKINGDIEAIKQYLDIILKTARHNGESIPESMNAKDLFRIIGLNTLKTMGSSAEETDNAWVNHSYLENGGNHTGIFSLFGKANQEPVAANFLPADTDIALQIQLNMQQLVPMLVDLGKLTGKDSVEAKMNTVSPEIGMSPADIISKVNATVSIGLDINTDESARKHPLSVLTNANAIIRIDGLTWLWDKVGDQIIQNSKAPMEQSVDPETGIIRYTVSKDLQAKMMGYLPQIIIDKKNDQIWITTNSSFHERCLQKDHKLIDSPEYKAATEKLPNKANSMFYVSKNTLVTAQAQYEFAADNNMFGKDFQKGKDIVDRIMEDVTESNKGWALVLTKDDTGVLVSSRGPVGVQHLRYITGIVSAGFYGTLSSRKAVIENIE